MTTDYMHQLLRCSTDLHDLRVEIIDEARRRGTLIDDAETRLDIIEQKLLNIKAQLEKARDESEH